MAGRAPAGWGWCLRQACAMGAALPSPAFSSATSAAVTLAGAFGARLGTVTAGRVGVGTARVACQLCCFDGATRAFMWGLSLRAYTMTLWAVSLGTQPHDCGSDTGGGGSGGGGGCGGRPPVLKAPRWVDCLLLLAGSDTDGLKIVLPSQGLVGFLAHRRSLRGRRRPMLCTGQGTCDGRLSGTLPLAVAPGCPVHRVRPDGKPRGGWGWRGGGCGRVASRGEAPT